MPCKILIVDANTEDRQVAKRACRLNNVEFIETSDCDNISTIIQETDLDCIILAYRFPSCSPQKCLEVVKELRSQSISIPIIVLTGQGDERVVVELLRAGVDDYIPKYKLSATCFTNILASVITKYRQNMSFLKATLQKLKKIDSQLDVALMT